MTPDALRDSLAALGLSQTRAAKLLQVEARTVRRWAAGRAPIPHAVELALAAMEGGFLPSEARP